MEILILLAAGLVGFYLYSKGKSARFTGALLSELIKGGMTPEKADLVYSMNHERIHHLYFQIKLPPSTIASELLKGWDGSNEL